MFPGTVASEGHGLDCVRPCDGRQRESGHVDRRVGPQGTVTTTYTLTQNPKVYAAKTDRIMG